ncbi:hypothetical protein DB88DRAFT_117528 [Papiliotrema laurentii]|uniref:Uncharacterized protein n=1 Tax=Papiliotrema laurentii TaxID=5418 RepID=A0AAD9CXN0_PAPLA|nr:hypothetical protein DB88DRAFT_117528 [Papiliotrema laurentii]
MKRFEKRSVRVVSRAWGGRRGAIEMCEKCGRLMRSGGEPRPHETEGSAAKEGRGKGGSRQRRVVAKVVVAKEGRAKEGRGKDRHETEGSAATECRGKGGSRKRKDRGKGRVVAKEGSCQREDGGHASSPTFDFFPSPHNAFIVHNVATRTVTSKSSTCLTPRPRPKDSKNSGNSMKKCSVPVRRPSWSSRTTETCSKPSKALPTVLKSGKP